MKIKYCIFVLTANANVYAHSVSSMVRILTILGKHKDHDVKTIRKSQPLVKAEVDKYLERFDHNVETLLIKKS